MQKILDNNLLWKSCSLEGGLKVNKIGDRETFGLDGTLQSLRVIF